MLRRILTSILSFIFLFPSYTANADDSFWWETTFGYSGAQVNRGTNINSIPMYARLRDLYLAVPKLNPDVLIVGIRFDEKFDADPLAIDKKLETGVRLWSAPGQNCIYGNKCDQVIYVGAPNYWTGIYPEEPGSAVVRTYKIPQNTNSDYPQPIDANCNAPWWIDRKTAPFNSIKFQLSISCLSLKADVYGYAFAAADIGITPIPANFTTNSGTTNPYWQLAEKAYTSKGGQSSVGIPYIGLQKKTSKFITCTYGKSTKYVKVGEKCPTKYKTGKIVLRQVDSNSI